jgi:carbon monoxide dehydrogenase subunit G
MPSALEFGGQEAIASSGERVLAALGDLSFVARLLPDVESNEVVDERTLRAVVRPGFSFLRGKLNVTIVRAADPAPNELAYRVESKGVGVTVVVETLVHVENTATGSADSATAALTWSAQVTQLSGLVAAISKPLIRAAAEQVIGQCWQRLRAELAGRAA